MLLNSIKETYYKFFLLLDSYAICYAMAQNDAVRIIHFRHTELYILLTMAWTLLCGDWDGAGIAV
ncbi:MAG: hypothetical protein ACI9CF_000037 [Candidatus Omnitrophota bacterium]|jgi:hypothetical protein